MVEKALGLRYKMTEIGEIPEEWEFTKLGDPKIINKMKAGGTPLKSVKTYYENGTIPFVKIEDVVKSSKYLTSTLEYITEEGLKNSSSWLSPKDSILFSMYASYGEVCINKIPVTTNQAIITIVPNRENVDITFLYYELKSLKSTLKQYLRSTTQSNLNAEIVKGLKMAIPPFPEQQKIAEILSHVDNLLESLDALISKKKNIKQGLMQKLLTRGIGHTRFKMTKIGEIPEEWEVVNMGDNKVSEIIMGQSPPSSFYNTSGEGMPFLQGNADFGETYPHRSIYSTKPLKIAEKGDILLSVRAPVGELNISGFKCIIGRGLAAIRCEDKKTHSKYLYYYLKFTVNRLRSLSAGSTFKAVGKDTLSNFEICLPDFEEQQKIAEILSDADREIEALEQKRDKYILLKTGMMQQLLTGRIRVK